MHSVGQMMVVQFGFRVCERYLAMLFVKQPRQPKAMAALLSTATRNYSVMSSIIDDHPKKERLTPYGLHWFCLASFLQSLFSTFHATLTKPNHKFGVVHGIFLRFPSDSGETLFSLCVFFTLHLRLTFPPIYTQPTTSVRADSS